MNKPLFFLPFIGGFLGYVLAGVFDVTDSITIFGIAVFGMIVAGVGGIIWSRRSIN
jgi:hypothetical protein